MNIFFKPFCRFFSKIVHFCVPIISRILIMFKIHSRIINQLNKLRSESHKTEDYRNLVSKILNNPSKI